MKEVWLIIGECDGVLGVYATEGHAQMALADNPEEFDGDDIDIQQWDVEGA